MTGDIRNGNGRTVKSRYATPDRVNHLSEKIDAVFWIMKDDSLPPIIKINDPVLAASFGATLATKRSDAENITTKRQLDELVIEPFANPFRVYPLREDYQAFRELFLKQQTACYVLNTGYFDDKKLNLKRHCQSLKESCKKRQNSSRLVRLKISTIYLYQIFLFLLRIHPIKIW